MSDTYALRKFVLERLHVYAQEHIDSVKEMNADVFFLADTVTERLVIRLQGHILAEKRVELRREVEFRFPISPWEFFKERHLPSWWTRRRPVRYSRHRKIVTFAEYASFPEFDPAFYPPRFGKPVIVQTTAVSDDLPA